MRLTPTNKTSLKKELGLLGSFSIGFADVGADIFLALGLIAAYAGGAMPLAILVASFVYACTGLAYAELASAIPVAGGAAAYGKRAFGNLAGFIGGWGLVLDYTIDIALFAVAATGYLTFFFPWIRESFAIVTAGLILLLVILNLFGIKESSAFNSALTVLALLVIISLLGLGFGTTFSLEKFTSYIQPISETPGWNNFLYSITLAMVTFIGIESISQAAEETKNPEKIIPKASGLAVLLVIVFALAISIMALGIATPEELKERVDNPLTAIALKLPFAEIVVPIIAFAGFIICYVSSNTGIIGVSRVAYALSKNNLITRKMRWVHPTFGTPWVTIIFFSAIALILAAFGDMYLLGELYAFGALTAYFIANVAVIKLRFAEPELNRPFKVPLNIKVSRMTDVPIISIAGAISCLAVFALVALLHEQGRILAGAWFVVGIAYYVAYTRYKEYLPEIDSFMEQTAKKKEATILFPVKLVKDEEDAIDMLENVYHQTKLPVTLLHVTQLPPTIPTTKGAQVNLTPLEQQQLNRIREKLQERNVVVRIALKNARNLANAINEFTQENDVKYVFLTKEAQTSKHAQEIEYSTDTQVITYEK
ncbi:APC family permease [Candidatus Micrarchaeota archaeon]|nr:APC family permease [Candidatus Micrarchaeota archaeon]